MRKILTDFNNGVYKKNVKLLKHIDNDNCIIINNKLKKQEWVGVGSALTEASAYNFSLLSDSAKEKFLTDYFSEKGLDFNFGRISIGSNDFSLKSFDYSSSLDLIDFNISDDFKYTLPFIKRVLNVKKIDLIASPWSPPKMYKNNNLLIGGKLKRKYYDKYALYLKFYLNAYKKEGVNIRYLTMQNEPFANQKWESCVYSLKQQKTFIYKYLIPKLDDTKVLLWDHNKENLPKVVDKLYKNNPLIGGVGFHYYTGSYFDNIKIVRAKYPNLLLINTEMCCGFSRFNELDWLNDAEIYLKELIGDANSGVNAFLDWNILLDEKGGPCHFYNPVKSSSIYKNGTYIKSPIYYYLYHFSHFIKQGSFILDVNNNSDLFVTAASTGKNIVVIVMNTQNFDNKFVIKISNRKISDQIPKRSIITYII